MKPKLDKEYWNSLYQAGETGWDIGDVSTPMKEYIDQLDNKDIAILIPGCGNAYEAAYLLKKGFTNVTLIDISMLAAEAVKERFKEYGNRVNVICGDFFKLEKKFDLILEQTFFCALDPSLRKNYAEKMYELLKENGKLVGVMFNRSFEGGPPFGGNMEEYTNLFAPLFDILQMEACYNSIAPRAGNEVFIRLKK
jgi:SAM-dependent methyltransferase